MNTIRGREDQMTRSFLILAAAALTLTCGCAASDPPTTMPSNTLLSVTIGCGGNGQPASVQCYATAHYSDAGRDVSSFAAWQSSNPNVATVSTGGLVKVVGVGKTTITATYDEQSGSLTLQFPDPLND